MYPADCLNSMLSAGSRLLMSQSELVTRPIVIMVVFWKEPEQNPQSQVYRPFQNNLGPYLPGQPGGAINLAPTLKTIGECRSAY